eukprot:4136676-Alexandrium_andersonii.AAC.1
MLGAAPHPDEAVWLWVACLGWHLQPPRPAQVAWHPSQPAASRHESPAPLLHSGPPQFACPDADRFRPWQVPPA